MPTARTRKPRNGANAAPARPIPDSLFELWTHRDTRALPPDVMRLFASKYWEYPREASGLVGKMGEPGWWQQGIHFVGTFSIADSDARFWLTCCVNGWWRVSQERS